MFTFEWSVIIPASVASAVVSGLFSYAVARHTSRAEIKRLKLTWKRHDTVSDDDSMRTALASVSLYLHGDSAVYYEQALAHVAAILGSYPGKLGQSIFDLHSALADCDYARIEECYASVISLYRREKATA